MLISFSLKNFKSFKDEMRLDFKPSRSKALNYSILQSGKHRALSTMVFYGANASGKSNFIKGLQTLKQFIQYGKVNDINALINIVSLHNFNTAPKEPIEFSIKFEYNDEIYDYFLSLILLDSEQFNLKVKDERLVKGNKEFFERKGNELKGFSEANNLDKGLLEGDLFLCNGFKLVDKDSFQQIYSWFMERLIIYTKIDYELLENIDAENKQIINEIAKVAGTFSEHIDFWDNESSRSSKSRTISLVNTPYYNFFMSSSYLESLGTLKLMSFLPGLINAFKKGATVLVDELDSSLHPMAVINLINIFHNDEINKNRAQLLFTTHNPIYLEAEVLRSDEVYIVDKDMDGNSTISCITSKGRITKKSSILNMYMRNDFGGIPDIDFSNLFMIKDEESNDDGEDCNE